MREKNGRTNKHKVKGESRKQVGREKRKGDRAIIEIIFPVNNTFPHWSFSASLEHVNTR